MMNKKTYIKPLSAVVLMEHLLEGGGGPVQNTGNGYNFKDDPVGGDELEGKEIGWNDEGDYDQEWNNDWNFNRQNLWSE